MYLALGVVLARRLRTAPQGQVEASEDQVNMRPCAAVPLSRRHSYRLPARLEVRLSLVPGVRDVVQLAERNRSGRTGPRQAGSCRASADDLTTDPMASNRMIVGQWSKRILLLGDARPQCGEVFVKWLPRGVRPCGRPDFPYWRAFNYNRYWRYP